MGKIDSHKVDFEPKDTKFVVHSSTIPLASTFDNQFFFQHEKCVADSCACPHADTTNSFSCSKRCCMFIRQSTNEYSSQFVPANCPCTLVRKRKEVKNLCFFSYLKSMSRPLLGAHYTDEYIDGDSVMICFDDSGIFDEKYPGQVRDVLGISSWKSMKEEHLVQALYGLYWFRKNAKRFFLTDVVRHSIKLLGLKSFKMWFKQTIHMINGMLVKQFFGFGPEIQTYSKLNEHIARLFKHILCEYAGPSVMNKFKTKPIFEEIKEFSKFVKEFGLCEDLNLRTKFLDFEFSNPALRAFYITAINSLKNHISFERTQGRDLTTSPAWKFRIAELHQTRVMGYVPQSIADLSSKEYRTILTRPREEPDPKLIKLIKLLIYKELKPYIKPHFLREEQSEEVLSQIKDILLKIELELKPTASTHHLVREGGKMEDARIFLNALIKTKFLVPIRDLETFEISRYLPPLEKEDVENISTYLFFLSIQIGINLVVNKGGLDKKFWIDLPEEFKDYEKTILDCQIIDVNEPGKLRELIKSSPILSWILTPASKICQAMLAIHPDHKSGLELGNQDWSHTKRISGDSDESYFMYDDDGFIKENIQFGFEDWTKATDFISRVLGLSALQAFMLFTGFPRRYGELILTLLNYPLHVTARIEMRIVSDNEGEPKYERIETAFEGYIHEGFMMGNQVTKTILHLTHVGEVSLAIQLLLKKGLHFSRERRKARLPDYIQPPKTLAEVRNHVLR